jgi:hypothetical protein
LLFLEWKLLFCFFDCQRTEPLLNPMSEFAGPPLLERDRRLRTDQARVAGKLPEPTRRYFLARHTQSCFSLLDPAELETCFL